MKAVGRSLYYLVVSPEAVVVIFVLFVLIVKPNWATYLSNILADAHDAAKYVAFVPVAIFAWCWKNAQEILFPPEDARGILQEWPRFSELKARVFTGIFFQVLFAVSSVVAWVVSPSLASPFSPVLVVGAIVGGGIGAWTLYMAAVAAREITKRANS